MCIGIYVFCRFFFGGNIITFHILFCMVLLIHVERNHSGQ